MEATGRAAGALTLTEPIIVSRVGFCHSNSDVEDVEDRNGGLRLRLAPVVVAVTYAPDE